MKLTLFITSIIFLLFGSNNLIKAAGKGSEFTSPFLYEMHQDIAYADKRGFADFNGDGIEDMIQIGGLLKSISTGKIFFGKLNEKRHTVFTKEGVEVKTSFSTKWFDLSSQTKLDTGDVNGDGLADLIISRLNRVAKTGRINFYRVGFAVNQGLDEKGVPWFKYVSIMKFEHQNLAQFIKSYFLDKRAEDIKNIDIYHRMDWVDMNNDKKDDFVIMWAYNCWPLACTDVEVTVLFNRSEGNELFLSRKHVTVVDDAIYIPKLFDGKSEFVFTTLEHMDTGDFNNDGYGDISFIKPRPMSDALTMKIYYNSQRNRFSFSTDGEFETTQYEMSYLNVGLKLAFEKRDAFDVNLDGCYDYIHAGLKDGSPSMSINLKTNCPQKTE